MSAGSSLSRPAAPRSALWVSRAPLVASDSVTRQLPAGMIEALGRPLAVTTGNEILRELRADQSPRAGAGRYPGSRKKQNLEKI
jgi:hypothetical protein